MTHSVYIHFLAFNSINTHGRDVLEASLNSINVQENIDAEIVVTDNASTDSTYTDLNDLNKKLEFNLKRNESNLGFCGAHNKELLDFLSSDKEFFLITTHDVSFTPQAIYTLCEALENNKEYSFATPLFYRADEKLNPIEPKIVDASGMNLNNTLRHFDINTLPENELTTVFGGTGAALLINRDAIKKLVLDTPNENKSLYRIYPELEKNSTERIQLFDEAFFAYREDADLAWRASLLNIKTVCVKSAIAYHKRFVLPERRSILPDKINALGVRNRFLLQINNYSITQFPEAFFAGVVFRNLLVIIAVIVKERSSLIAFKELFILRKRAFKRRKVLFERVKSLRQR